MPWHAQALARVSPALGRVPAIRGLATRHEAAAVSCITRVICCAAYTFRMDLERLSRDRPIVRLCNAILLSAIKKGARRFTMRRTPTFVTVEFELNGVMVDEMHPPMKLFDAIVKRFALMANVPADSQRGRAQGVIHLFLGRGRHAYHPLVIEGRGDARVLSVGCISEAEWRAELEQNVQRAEAAEPLDRAWLAQALQGLGIFANGKEEAALAQSCFERAVQCMDHEHTDHDQLGGHLRWLGCVLWQRADYSGARNAYERAALEQAMGGPDGLVDAAGVGLGLESLGDCLSRLDEPERAIESYQRAIEQYQRGNLDGRIDYEAIARCLDGVGYRLFEQNKLDEAISWFRRALEAHARGDAHGEVDHEHAGRSLFALADCAWAKECYGDALELYEASAREKTLQGEEANHPSLAHSLYWAGRSAFALDRFSHAQALFERALAEHERGGHDEHVDHSYIAWSQSRIAQCRFKLGQPADAQAWFELALESMARVDVSDTVHAEDLVRMRALRAECLDS